MKNYIDKFAYTLILLVSLFSFKLYSQACSFTINNNPQITINQSGSPQNFGITTSCNLSNISFSSNLSWVHVSINSGSLQISCDQNTGYDRLASVNILYNQQPINGFTVHQNGSGTEPPAPCVVNGFQSTTFNSFGESITYNLTTSNCGSNSWNPFTFTTTGGNVLPSWIASNISQNGTSIIINLSENNTGSFRHEIVKGTTSIGGSTVEIYGDIAQASCLKTWYKDADGDGFAELVVAQCDDPGVGYTETAMSLGDCDDSDSDINPDTEWYLDADNDGHAISKKIACIGGIGYYLNVLPIDDCNDSPETGGNINPSTIWYQDTDGDGFGDPSVSITQCNQPNEYVLDNTDQCPTINAPTSDCTGYSNENYVFTRVYQTSMDNSSEITNDTDVIEQITYFDGLGRAKQSISIRAGGNSVNSEDIITPFVYDDYGRQVKEYLPYATASQGGFIFNDPVSAVESFYFKPKYENTENPYSEKVFEPSPLNRVIEQGAPGADWSVNNPNSHTIKFDQVSNKTNDQVRLFTVEFTPSFGLGENGYYSANELFKSITKDENWKQADGKNYTTEEFKDKLGRVVLKRAYNDGIKHDTYYVYDKYGNLTYVLPPKVDVTTATLTVINGLLNDLCYQYKYDDRNRLVEKKIPGKGWEYIVYNTLDQPVLIQDANFRSQNKWLFTKYDAFGRVTYAGIHNNNSSRESLQAAADNTSTYEQFVTKINTAATYAGTDVFYNNAAIPNGMAEIHTINYYDNYTFDKAGLTLPTGSIYGQTIAAGAEVKGLPIGSKVRVLESNPVKWITTITIYDKKGLPIYVASKNEYLETTDVVQTEYDFTGKVLKTRTRHQKDSENEIVTLDTFEYDHMGRLLNQIQCVGDDSLPDDCSGVGNVANLVLTSPVTTSKTEVASTSIVMDTGFIVDAIANPGLSFTASIESGGEQIVANHYDELGQLDYKNVGGKPSPSGGGATGGGGLQTVDYTYNIRGWLKEINDPNSLGTDLFAFGIKYNTPEYSPSTRGLFNGNISEAHWITANDNKNRNYRYEYDALNRIIDAINIGENEGHRYRVVNITYDKNGNLLTLHRNGWKNEVVSYGNIDVLEYTYDSGNKLTKVKDYGSGGYGFKDGTNTGNDYDYDANGNMTKDFNKEIGNATTNGITYNHLNLPTEVKFNNLNTRKINYIYSADGVKLQKLVNDNGNMTTTDYAGNYIYENNILQFFNTAEGYFNVTNSPPSGELEGNYVYQYKDHLGNIRLSYSDADGNGSIDAATEILEENNYYPFGGSHKGYNNVINGTDHKYGFGGKEEQGELGLGWMDFGARNYDKWLGRWMNIDPLADKYRDFTPYNYTANNPILYMDPDGRDIIISGNTKDAMFKLAQIAATRTGSLRLNRLIKSRSNYTMESVFWSSNSSYDPQKNNIKYPSSVWRYSIDGGAPGASYVAGHEVTHAYNDDMGHRLTRKQHETSSVNFGNYMRSVYGEKKMRTSYFGLGLKFGKNEKLYNFKQEKVNDFKQTLDVSTGGNTFAGFSYETSSNGEESTTEYILSVTTKDGTYAYRKFTDKKEYDAASKRVNDLKKKEEKEDEKK